MDGQLDWLLRYLYLEIQAGQPGNCNLLTVDMASPVTRASLPMKGNSVTQSLSSFRHSRLGRSAN